MNVPIEELIAQARSGDRTACEVLFARYQPYLLVLARSQLGRHLRGKCEASDVVQQTLLEAFRDFAHFQGQREVELLAWLRRMLANNLYNEARRFATQARATEREISLDQICLGLDQSSLLLGQQVAASGPTPIQDALQREQSVLVATALAQLAEDYQTVLILRVFEGLSAEEVAVRLNRTAGAVRMLQMRALAALKEAIQTLGNG
ncbi:MAG: sigma-70 family RNA polymerase sigma factor [Gemmataceae bacterium]